MNEIIVLSSWVTSLPRVNAILNYLMKSILLIFFLSTALPLSQLLEISQYQWGTCYFLDKLYIQILWEGQIKEPSKFSDGLWLEAPAHQQACLSGFVFVLRCPVWSCLFINNHPNELHQMFNIEGIHREVGKTFVQSRLYLIGVCRQLLPFIMTWTTRNKGFPAWNRIES